MKIHLPLSIKRTKKQVCMGCKTEVQYFDCNNRNTSSEKQYTENKGISRNLIKVVSIIVSGIQPLSFLLISI